MSAVTCPVHVPTCSRAVVTGCYRSTFVHDNVLFYAVLLRSFVKRSLRLDLASPKHAYMLARVTKVYDLPNLRDLICSGL